jgi:hypothetical protein
MIRAPFGHFDQVKPSASGLSDGVDAGAAADASDGIAGCCRRGIAADVLKLLKSAG